MSKSNKNRPLTTEEQDKMLNAFQQAQENPSIKLSDLLTNSVSESAYKTEYSKDSTAGANPRSLATAAVVTAGVLSSSATQDHSAEGEVSAKINVVTRKPTSRPSQFPTRVPSKVPTRVPSNIPTVVPTTEPSNIPTGAPVTNPPTTGPTTNPSPNPTGAPATNPPSARPTRSPTALPSAPVRRPTVTPTTVPTTAPSAAGRRLEENENLRGSNPQYSVGFYDDNAFKGGNYSVSSDDEMPALVDAPSTKVAAVTAENLDSKDKSKEGSRDK